MRSLTSDGGTPITPDELWHLHPDPVVVVGLTAALLLYVRGGPRYRGLLQRRRNDLWRPVAFCLGVGAIAIALVSPLDPMSASLASAHMVQHLLLVLIAAPLICLAAPSNRLWRGVPPSVRRSRPLKSIARHRALRELSRWLRMNPLICGLAHTATIWLWHSSTPYDLALRSSLIHRLEHASLWVTAVIFWHSIVSRRGTDLGFRMIVVFAAGFQMTLLAALITFARSPWYSSYKETTDAWGLSHLADQQLAGAIMWVPAGLVYVIAGLGLLHAWIRRSGASLITAKSPSPQSTSSPGY